MRGVWICFVVSCQYEPSAAVGDAEVHDVPIDLAVDSPVDESPSVYMGFSDASTGGTAGFYLYAAFGTSTDSTAFPGSFFSFGVTRVKVDVFNIDCSTTGPTEGMLVQQLPVTIAGTTPTQKYQMLKNVTMIGTGLVTGNCYRVKPLLDGFPLGFADFQVTSGAAPAPLRKVTPGSNLTVKFRTESSLNTDTDGDGIPDWRDP